MCSGCSGDYAGGFEELGESANKASSGDGPAGWDRPKEDGNPLKRRKGQGLRGQPECSMEFPAHPSAGSHS